MPIGNKSLFYGIFKAFSTGNLCLSPLFDKPTQLRPNSGNTLKTHLAFLSVFKHLLNGGLANAQLSGDLPDRLPLQSELVDIRGHFIGDDILPLLPPQNFPSCFGGGQAGLDPFAE
jgi:hypothetical protein